MKDAYQYFKMEGGKQFIAINKNADKYINVSTYDFNTAISVTSYNAKDQLAYVKRSKKYTSSNAEEFVDAIGEANSVLHQTPFL